MSYASRREAAIEAELADLYARLEKVQAQLAAALADPDSEVDTRVLEDTICDIRSDIEDIEDEAERDEQRSLEAWAAWATGP